MGVNVQIFTHWEIGTELHVKLTEQALLSWEKNAIRKLGALSNFAGLLNNSI